MKDAFPRGSGRKTALMLAVEDNKPGRLGRGRYCDSFDKQEIDIVRIMSEQISKLRSTNPNK